MKNASATHEPTDPLSDSSRTLKRNWGSRIGSVFLWVVITFFLTLGWLTLMGYGVERFGHGLQQESSRIIRTIIKKLN